MKYVLLAGAMLLSANVAIAQQRPANPDGNTPAVATPKSSNPTAPVEGANSFTEGQAKSRIESHGYTNVSGLAKDAQGIWRGRATREGKQVDVSLDYQGNVTTN